MSADIQNGLTDLAEGIRDAASTLAEALGPETIVSDGLGFPGGRVRMNHKWTQKDGWRLDETSVELQIPGSTEALDHDWLHKELLGLMTTIYITGSNEARARNRTDEERADG